MVEKAYILSFDIGTTGNKTCLFEIGERIALVASAMGEYDLHIGADGAAEQKVDDWWRAMCETTAQVLVETGIEPSAVKALSFCSQMHGLVLVDKDGQALRNAMSYMDQRAQSPYRRGIRHGLKISGLNARKILKSLYISGGASASVKDPLWKYLWIKENEPEVFRRVYKWLDVKEYLLLRCTRRFVTTHDSANATFMYDSREGHFRWSQSLCKTFGVDIRHFPEVVRSTDIVGTLTPEAASDLGLSVETQVFGGGGDVTMATVGAGCVRPGDTHVYIGTSGWVARVLDRRKVDLRHFIGSIMSARLGYYNYIAEQETSGKCLEWVKNHLALDEINVYLEKTTVVDEPESRYTSLLDFLGQTVREEQPGCGGVIFTPWLHGNRCPFEDHHARGMFFNIGLDTGKRKLIRAVLEGICYHKRWMLECIEAKTGCCSTVRFVGGGAISDVTGQILADILDKPVEVTDHPQNAGATGAAALCGVGLGIIPSFDDVPRSIPIRTTFVPDREHAAVHQKTYRVFKSLYADNRTSFARLNRQTYP
jgi:xylulokinase